MRTMRCFTCVCKFTLSWVELSITHIWELSSPANRYRPTSCPWPCPSCTKKHTEASHNCLSSKCRLTSQLLSFFHSCSASVIDQQPDIIIRVACSMFTQCRRDVALTFVDRSSQIVDVLQQEHLACSAMLCIARLLPSPGVRPSVYASGTFVSCAKTNKDIIEIFSPTGSDTILVFPY